MHFTFAGLLVSAVLLHAWLSVSSDLPTLSHKFQSPNFPVGTSLLIAADLSNCSYASTILHISPALQCSSFPPFLPLFPASAEIVSTSPWDCKRRSQSSLLCSRASTSLTECGDALELTVRGLSFHSASPPDEVSAPVSAPAEAAVDHLRMARNAAALCYRLSVSTMPIGRDELPWLGTGLDSSQPASMEARGAGTLPEYPADASELHSLFGTDASAMVNAGVEAAGTDSGGNSAETNAADQDVATNLATNISADSFSIHVLHAPPKHHQQPQLYQQQQQPSNFIASSSGDEHGFEVLSKSDAVFSSSPFTTEVEEGETTDPPAPQTIYNVELNYTDRKIKAVVTSNIPVDLTVLASGICADFPGNIMQGRPEPTERPLEMKSLSTNSVNSTTIVFESADLYCACGTYITVNATVNDDLHEKSQFSHSLVQCDQPDLGVEILSIPETSRPQHNSSKAVTEYGLSIRVIITRSAPVFWPAFSVADGCSVGDGDNPLTESPIGNSFTLLLNCTASKIMPEGLKWELGSISLWGENVTKPITITSPRLYPHVTNSLIDLPTTLYRTLNANIRFRSSSLASDAEENHDLMVEVIFSFNNPQNRMARITGLASTSIVVHQEPKLAQCTFSNDSRSTSCFAEFPNVQLSSNGTIDWNITVNNAPPVNLLGLNVHVDVDITRKTPGNQDGKLLAGISFKSAKFQNTAKWDADESRLGSASRYPLVNYVEMNKIEVAYPSVQLGGNTSLIIELAPNTDVIWKDFSNANCSNMERSNAALFIRRKESVLKMCEASASLTAILLTNETDKPSLPLSLHFISSAAAVSTVLPILNPPLPQLYLTLPGSTLKPVGGESLGAAVCFTIDSSGSSIVAGFQNGDVVTFSVNTGPHEISLKLEKTIHLGYKIESCAFSLSFDAATIVGVISGRNFPKNENQTRLVLLFEFQEQLFLASENEVSHFFPLAPAAVVSDWNTTSEANFAFADCVTSFADMQSSKDVKCNNTFKQDEIVASAARHGASYAVACTNSQCWQTKSDGATVVYSETNGRIITEVAMCPAATLIGLEPDCFFVATHGSDTATILKVTLPPAGESAISVATLVQSSPVVRMFAMPTRSQILLVRLRSDSRAWEYVVLQSTTHPPTEFQFNEFMFFSDKVNFGGRDDVPLIFAGASPTALFVFVANEKKEKHMYSMPLFPHISLSVHQSFGGQNRAAVKFSDCSTPSSHDLSFRALYRAYRREQQSIKFQRCTYDLTTSSSSVEFCLNDKLINLECTNDDGDMADDTFATHLQIDHKGTAIASSLPLFADPSENVFLVIQRQNMTVGVKSSYKLIVAGTLSDHMVQDVTLSTSLSRVNHTIRTKNTTSAENMQCSSLTCTFQDSIPLSDIMIVVETDGSEVEFANFSVTLNVNSSANSRTVYQQKILQSLPLIALTGPALGHEEKTPFFKNTVVGSVGFVFSHAFENTKDYNAFILVNNMHVVQLYIAGHKSSEATRGMFAESSSLPLLKDPVAALSRSGFALVIDRVSGLAAAFALHSLDQKDLPEYARLLNTDLVRSVHIIDSATLGLEAFFLVGKSGTLSNVYPLYFLGQEASLLPQRDDLAAAVRDLSQNDRPKIPSGDVISVLSMLDIDSRNSTVAFVMESGEVDIYEVTGHNWSLRKKFAELCRYCRIVAATMHKSARSIYIATTGTRLFRLFLGDANFSGFRLMSLAVKLHEDLRHITSLSLHPLGHSIALGFDSGDIVLVPLTSDGSVDTAGFSLPLHMTRDPSPYRRSTGMLSIASISFSPDGRYLLAVPKQTESGSMRMYTVAKLRGFTATRSLFPADICKTQDNIRSSVWSLNASYFDSDVDEQREKCSAFFHSSIDLTGVKGYDESQYPLSLAVNPKTGHGQTQWSVELSNIRYPEGVDQITADMSVSLTCMPPKILIPDSEWWRGDDPGEWQNYDKDTGSYDIAISELFDQTIAERDSQLIQDCNDFLTFRFVTDEQPQWFDHINFGQVYTVQIEITEDLSMETIGQSLFVKVRDDYGAQKRSCTVDGAAAIKKFFKGSERLIHVSLECTATSITELCDKKLKLEASFNQIDWSESMEFLPMPVLTGLGFSWKNGVITTPSVRASTSVLYHSLVCNQDYDVFAFWKNGPAPLSQSLSVDMKEGSYSPKNMAEWHQHISYVSTIIRNCGDSPASFSISVYGREQQSVELPRITSSYVQLLFSNNFVSPFNYFPISTASWSRSLEVYVFHTLQQVQGNLKFCEDANRCSKQYACKSVTTTATSDRLFFANLATQENLETCFEDYLMNFSRDHSVTGGPSFRFIISGSYIMVMNNVLLPQQINAEIIYTMPGQKLFFRKVTRSVDFAINGIKLEQRSNITESPIGISSSTTSVGSLFNISLESRTTASITISSVWGTTPLQGGCWIGADKAYLERLRFHMTLGTRLNEPSASIGSSLTHSFADSNNVIYVLCQPLKPLDSSHLRLDFTHISGVLPSQLLTRLEDTLGHIMFIDLQTKIAVVHMPSNEDDRFVFADEEPVAFEKDPNEPNSGTLRLALFVGRWNTETVRVRMSLSSTTESCSLSSSAHSEASVGHEDEVVITAEGEKLSTVFPFEIICTSYVPQIRLDVTHLVSGHHDEIVFLTRNAISAQLDASDWEPIPVPLDNTAADPVVIPGYSGGEAHLLITLTVPDFKNLSKIADIQTVSQDKSSNVPCSNNLKWLNHTFYSLELVCFPEGYDNPFFLRVSGSSVRSSLLGPFLRGSEVSFELFSQNESFPIRDGFIPIPEISVAKPEPFKPPCATGDSCECSPFQSIPAEPPIRFLHYGTPVDVSIRFFRLEILRNTTLTLEASHKKCFFSTPQGQNPGSTYQITITNATQMEVALFSCKEPPGTRVYFTAKGRHFRSTQTSTFTVMGDLGLAYGNSHNIYDSGAITQAQNSGGRSFFPHSSTTDTVNLEFEDHNRTTPLTVRLNPAPRWTIRIAVELISDAQCFFRLLTEDTPDGPSIELVGQVAIATLGPAFSEFSLQLYCPGIVYKCPMYIRARQIDAFDYAPVHSKPLLARGTMNVRPADDIPYTLKPELEWISHFPYAFKVDFFPLSHLDVPLELTVTISASSENLRLFVDLYDDIFPANLSESSTVVIPVRAMPRTILLVRLLKSCYSKRSVNMGVVSSQGMYYMKSLLPFSAVVGYVPLFTSWDVNTHNYFPRQYLFSNSFEIFLIYGETKQFSVVLPSGFHDSMEMDGVLQRSYSDSEQKNEMRQRTYSLTIPMDSCSRSVSNAGTITVSAGRFPSIKVRTGSGWRVSGSQTVNVSNTNISSQVRVATIGYCDNIGLVNVSVSATLLSLSDHETVSCSLSSNDSAVVLSHNDLTFMNISSLNVSNGILFDFLCTAELRKDSAPVLGVSEPASVSITLRAEPTNRNHIFESYTFTVKVKRNRCNHVRIDHAAVIYDDGGLGIRNLDSTARVRCDHDYDFLDDENNFKITTYEGLAWKYNIATLTCGSTGSWGNLPVCKVRQCGAIPEPPTNSLPPVLIHTGVDGVTSLYSRYRMGCGVGYSLPLNETIMTCERGGWHPKIPSKCNPISCGSYNFTRFNSHVIFTTTGEGMYNLHSQAIATCEDYHAKAAGDESRTCLDTGRWSGFPLMCKESVCVVPAPADKRVEKFSLEGEQVTPQNATGWVKKGTLMVATCDEGYEFEEEKTQELAIFCDPELLSWNRTTPPCVPIFCSPISHKYDGAETISQSLLPINRYQSVATLECKHGWRPGSVSQVTCAANKTWVPDLMKLSCERIECSPPPEFTEDVIDTLPSFEPVEGMHYLRETTPDNNSMGLLFGSVIRYSCKLGYNLKTDDWGEPVNSTDRLHPDTGYSDNSDAQGNSHSNDDTNAPSDSLKYAYRSCDASGVWGPDRPIQCQIHDCGLPPFKGSNENGSSNRTTYGSLWTYECDSSKGFELRFCSDNDENSPFENNPQRCIRDGDPAGANFFHSCTEDGWSPKSTVTCGYVTCPQPSKESRSNELSKKWMPLDASSSTTQYRFGSTFTRFCSKGYYAQGTKSAHVLQRCSALKTWEPEVLEPCVDIDECDPYLLDGREHVQCEELLPGSTCINTEGSYICSPTIIPDSGKIRQGETDVARGAKLQLPANEADLYTLEFIVDGGETKSSTSSSGLPTLKKPYIEKVKVGRLIAAGSPATVEYDCTNVQTALVSDTSPSAESRAHYAVSCSIPAGQGHNLAVTYCFIADGFSECKWNAASRDFTQDTQFSTVSTVWLSYAKHVLPSGGLYKTDGNFSSPTARYIISHSDVSEKLLILIRSVDIPSVINQALLSIRYGRNNDWLACTVNNDDTLSQKSVSFSLPDDSKHIICETQTQGSGIDLSLEVTIAGQTVLSNDTISYSTKPEILTISGCLPSGSSKRVVDCPTSGMIDKNTHSNLTITGHNFLPPLTVTVGSECTIVDFNSSTIICKLPEGTGENVMLTVSSGGMRDDLESAVGYASPVLISIMGMTSSSSSGGCTPSSAGVAKDYAFVDCRREGGDVIAFKGSNFGLNPIISINRRPCVVSWNLNGTGISNFDAHSTVYCMTGTGTARDLPVTIVQRGGRALVHADSSRAPKLSYQQCGEGQRNADNLACTDCEPGQHTDPLRPGTCFDCSPGTYADSPTHTCFPCKPGYFADAGAAACTPCPRGFFSVGGATVCTPCSQNMYNDKMGSGECATCPLGTRGTPDNSFCICNEGSYLTQTGECKPCIQGGDCSRPGSTAYSLLSLRGFAPAILPKQLLSNKTVDVVMVMRSARLRDPTEAPELESRVKSWIFNPDKWWTVPEGRVLVRSFTRNVPSSSGGEGGSGAKSKNVQWSPSLDDSPRDNDAEDMGDLVSDSSYELSTASPRRGTADESSQPSENYPTFTARLTVLPPFIKTENSSGGYYSMFTESGDQDAAQIASDIIIAMHEFDPTALNRSSSSYEVDESQSRHALVSFLPCVNGACLRGSTCAEGHKGELCTVCGYGYGRVGTYECGKCNKAATRLLILVASMVAAFIVCTVLAWKQITDGKNQIHELPPPAVPVLFKIITSGAQVMAIAARYDLEWPSFIKPVFETSETTTAAGTAFISLDCFLDAEPIVRPIWATSAAIAIMPILGLILPALALLPLYFRARSEAQLRLWALSHEYRRSVVEALEKHSASLASDRSRERIRRKKQLMQERLHNIYEANSDEDNDDGAEEPRNTTREPGARKGPLPPPPQAPVVSSFAQPSEGATYRRRALEAAAAAAAAASAGGSDGSSGSSRSGNVAAALSLPRGGSGGVPGAIGTARAQAIGSPGRYAPPSGGSPDRVKRAATAHAGGEDAVDGGFSGFAGDIPSSSSSLSLSLSGQDMSPPPQYRPRSPFVPCSPALSRSPPPTQVQGSGQGTGVTFLGLPRSYTATSTTPTASSRGAKPFTALPTSPFSAIQTRQLPRGAPGGCTSPSQAILTSRLRSPGPCVTTSGHPSGAAGAADGAAGGFLSPASVGASPLFSDSYGGVVSGFGGFSQTGSSHSSNRTLGEGFYGGNRPGSSLGLGGSVVTGQTGSNGSGSGNGRGTFSGIELAEYAPVAGAGRAGLEWQDSYYDGDDEELSDSSDGDHAAVTGGDMHVPSAASLNTAVAGTGPGLTTLTRSGTSPPTSGHAPAAPADAGTPPGTGTVAATPASSHKKKHIKRRKKVAKTPASRSAAPGLTASDDASDSQIEDHSGGTPIKSVPKSEQQRPMPLSPGRNETHAITPGSAASVVSTRVDNDDDDCHSPVPPSLPSLPKATTPTALAPGRMGGSSLITRRITCLDQGMPSLEAGAVPCFEDDYHDFVMSEHENDEAALGLAWSGTHGAGAEGRPGSPSGIVLSLESQRSPSAPAGVTVVPVKLSKKAIQGILGKRAWAAEAGSQERETRKVRFAMALGEKRCIAVAAAAADAAAETAAADTAAGTAAAADRAAHTEGTERDKIRRRKTKSHETVDEVDQEKKRARGTTKKKAGAWHFNSEDINLAPVPIDKDENLTWLQSEVGLALEHDEGLGIDCALSSANTLFDPLHDPALAMPSAYIDDLKARFRFKYKPSRPDGVIDTKSAEFKRSCLPETSKDLYLNEEIRAAAVAAFYAACADKTAYAKSLDSASRMPKGRGLSAVMKEPHVTGLGAAAAPMSDAEAAAIEAIEATRNKGASKVKAVADLAASETGEDAEAPGAAAGASTAPLRIETIAQDAEDLANIVAISGENPQKLKDAVAFDEHTVRSARLALRQHPYLRRNRDAQSAFSLQSDFERKRKAIANVLTVNEKRRRVAAAIAAIRDMRESFFGYWMTAVTVVMFLLHPSITRQFFVILSCKNIGPSQEHPTPVLLGDMRVPCYSAEHSFFILAIALPMCILWVIGIPLMAFVALYTNRRLIQLPPSIESVSRKMRQWLLKSDVPVDANTFSWEWEILVERKRNFEARMSFLYRGYKPTRYYWFLVDMGRKVVLVAIAVFLPAALHTQLMIASLLIATCLVAHIKLRPLENSVTDKVELTSLGASFMIFFFANFFFVKGSTYNTRVLCTVLIFSVIFVFFVVSGVAIVILVREQIRLAPLRSRLLEAALKGEDKVPILKEWRDDMEAARRAKEKRKEEKGKTSFWFRGIGRTKVPPAPPAPKVTDEGVLGF